MHVLSLRPRAALLAALLLTAVAATAQQTSAPATPQVAAEKSPDDAAALAKQLNDAAGDDAPSSTATAMGPVGLIPATRGFNVSLATISQHDSADGWANILTPTVAYRLDKHFSFTATVPTYPYINVVKTTSTKGPLGLVTKTTSSLQTAHFLLGDTAVSALLDLHSKPLDYNFTATMGAPTGDYVNGLGAGQYTYAFVNHFEHPFGDTFTPDIELGIDDSPNLLTPRVLKSYTVVGTSAHFQAGVDISLPFLDADFDTEAYEELPIGTVAVTSTTTKGKKGKQITTVTQESAGEDNGFTNNLDIPITGHIVLSGFYYRSLRNHDDTAGFSITFLLRAPRKSKEHAK